MQPATLVSTARNNVLVDFSVMDACRSAIARMRIMSNVIRPLDDVSASQSGEVCFSNLVFLHFI